jgi:signal transduction histidine kinase
LGLSRTYPSEEHWPSRRLINAALFIGLAFAGVAAFSPFVVHDVTLTPAGPTRKPGVLYMPFALFLLTGCVIALSAFTSKWRAARGQERAQLQYLAAGLFILGVGALTANLLVPLFGGHSRYSWSGPFFVLVLLGLVGHAIIRHRLMDLRPVIHRGLARLVVTAIVAVIAIIIARATIAVTGTRDLTLNADAVVALIVVLVSFSTPAQILFAKFIDPYLYRSSTDYGRALRSATRRLTRLMDPSSVSTELRAILQAQLAPEGFALLVRRPDRDEFEACDDHARQFLPLLAPSQPLWELSFSSVPPHTAITEAVYTDEDGASRMRVREAGVAVAVCLGRRERRLGLILLGPRRSGDAYFRDDLAFIESVAELASVALENGNLYRERVTILEYSERLLEALDSAVIAADSEGRITRYNRAAAELFAFGRTRLPVSIAELPSEVGWAFAFALREAWNPHDVEVTIDHRDRGLVPAVMSTTILSEQSSIVGALLVITDLSAVKALEANQRRLERLSVMARFYAGIAHEIRSPLTAISNFISLLGERFDDPEYRETALRLLPLEVNRIVQLAERLRLMAPSEGGQLTAVDLGSLLRDLVRLQTSGNPSATRVSLVCPDALPRILGDARQLTQLFLNLLNNAREAMPHGGEIRIVATADDSSGPRTVTVSIMDEGTGIEAAYCHRVFEPFFTTKASGTGLGLSICREIAEFHRATLTLSRRAQGGTVAEVRFSILGPSLGLLDDASNGTWRLGQPPNRAGFDRRSNERSANAS